MNKQVEPNDLQFQSNKRITVSKETLRLRAHSVQFISDVTTIGLSFLLANWIYLNDLNNDDGVVFFTIFAPVYVAVGFLTGAYSSEALAKLRKSVVACLSAIIYTAAILLLVMYMLKAGADFSRAVFAIGMGTCIVATISARAIVHSQLLKMLNGSPYATIVVCDGLDFEGDPSDLKLDLSEIGFDPATTDPFQFDRFARAVGHADRLVVACNRERQAAWISVLKSLTLDGEIVTDDKRYQEVISIGRYVGQKTLVVNSGPLGLRNRIVKRALDLTLASIACVLLIPLIIVVVIAIKVESAGPALFKQSRIGRNNRIFKVYKFRSMYTNMCDANAAQLTMRADPRVTRVGAFIRRTSIDELPQLFNILMGDMSLVGPRPHPLSAKAADQLYWDVDPTYRHRHSIKPGLTGLAQVRGYRGNTERTEDLTNRLQSDLEYAANWSLTRDMQIIFRTLLVVKHSNAF